MVVKITVSHQLRNVLVDHHAFDFVAITRFTSTI
jgi:hypothetical protein